MQEPIMRMAGSSNGILDLWRRMREDVVRGPGTCRSHSPKAAKRTTDSEPAELDRFRRLHRP